MDIFVKRFNELLKDTGSKQSEIAEYCHISKQSVNGYVKGREFPSIPILISICKYFNVSTDYLLGLTDYY